MKSMETNGLEVQDVEFHAFVRKCTLINQLYLYVLFRQYYNKCISQANERMRSSYGTKTCTLR